MVDGGWWTCFRSARMQCQPADEVFLFLFFIFITLLSRYAYGSAACLFRRKKVKNKIRLEGIPTVP